jgi:hypothetical protein
LIGRLDDVSFKNGNPGVSLSGAGSHFRHCIDFYNCFLTEVGTGSVNYDLRTRDDMLEASRALAIEELGKIIEGLRKLLLIDGSRALQVVLEDGAAPHVGVVRSRSSVKRELQFLLSHTIHHYALIALALRLQGFEPGEEFGLAPSTLEYRRKSA